MEILHQIDSIIAIIFFVCYFYQFVYIPIVLLFRRKKKAPPTEQLHDFAVLICARNEEKVIGDLVESLHQQTYDPSRIHVFVMADNCTDGTAAAAQAAGATVYQRQNRQQVGKGYALQALLGHIHEDYPDGFDGYFVFDADNLLRRDYIEQMNRTFSMGYEVVTGYRNSKNYGDNWISAGYALWFLRESRFLNHARYLLGASCGVSGTGFLFSRKIAQEMVDWPYHMLTEDIQFAADQITKGRKIGFCPDAELYDEQPVLFSQSWRQRMRWARGYLQVVFGFGGRLLKGIFKGNFSCFDMLMNIAPAYILSVVSTLINVGFAVYAGVAGQSLLVALEALGYLLLWIYLSIFFIGVVTVISEWKKIHTSTFKKIVYAFTFPLFMGTFIPISLAALFRKVEWKPIHHSVSVKDLKQKSEQITL